MPMYRVRTQFTGVTGSPWLSTINFDAANTVGTQALADAAVVAVGNFWSGVKSLINTVVAYTTLPDVLVLNDSGVATNSWATTPVASVGTSGSTLLPIASQIVVRGLTSTFVGGRQLRGRIFIPGLTTASDAAGAVAGATLTQVTTAANTLNGVAAPSWSIWSRVNATVVPVSAVSVWSQFAVLRSRRD